MDRQEEQSRKNDVMAVAQSLLGYLVDTYLREHSEISDGQMDKMLNNTFRIAEKFVEKCEKFNSEKG